MRNSPEYRRNSCTARSLRLCLQPQVREFAWAKLPSSSILLIRTDMLSPTASLRQVKVFTS